MISTTPRAAAADARRARSEGSRVRRAQVRPAGVLAALLRPAATTTALALVAVAPVAAQVTIERGVTWEEGTRLASAEAGISFTVPEGFRATWDVDLGAVSMTARDGSVLAAVWGWSEGSVTEVEAAVAPRLSAAGVRAEPRAPPTGDDRRAEALYDAATEDGPGVLYAVIEVGVDGNAIGVATLGPPAAESRVRNLARAIVAAVDWTAPAAAAWRSRAEGTVLTTAAGSSDYSPGGAGGGGSAASERRSTLRLCGGGAYAFETSRETYVSIEGASASSTSRDAHQGAWYLVADLLGAATLVLEAGDGRVFHWAVEEYGSDFIVDGTAYGVAGSC